MPAYATLYDLRVVLNEIGRTNWIINLKLCDSLRHRFSHKSYLHC